MRHNLKFQLICLFLLLSSTLFVGCVDFREEWVEMANSPLLSNSKASTVEFYDNYELDTSSANKVASFAIPAGAFEKDNVLLSMHFYNFPLLNEELLTLNYGMQSFLGKDSSNVFVYFMAKQLKGEHIFTSTKKVDVTLNFKPLIIHQSLNYRLFKIKMPDYFNPMSNAMGGSNGYKSNELYKIISSRFSNGLSELSAFGLASMLNWEEVTDAVLESSKTEKGLVTAKFSTTNFDYVYCLFAQILPFPIMRHATKLQSGVAILNGNRMPSERTNSEIENFVFVEMDTKPKQIFYYKEYKDKAKLVEFLGTFTGEIPPNVKTLDAITQLFPIDTIKMISKEDLSLEVLARGLKSYYYSTGDLNYRELRLPLKVEEKIIADFGWYGSDYTAKTDWDGEIPVISVKLVSGVELILTPDYKYYSIKGNDLVKHPLVYRTLTENPIFMEFTDSDLKGIYPYIENDSTVKYAGQLKDNSVVFFDKTGLAIDVLQSSFKVSELPLALINLAATEIGVPDPNLCSKNVSITGKTYFKIEQFAGKVLFYEANSLIKAYEQEFFNSIPLEIATALERDFPGQSVADIGYFQVNYLPALEIKLPDDSKTASVTYDFDGVKLAENTKLEIADIQNEAVRTKIQKKLEWYIVESCQYAEVFEKQKFYKVYITDFLTGKSKLVLFTAEGKYILGLE